ncbi:hypothetical protein C21_04751 [Arenibacter sp. NBRC 103722]|uniref:hypothetical protein n=1 Tax=Arenibacter sp. NBRC 103722 TaxID=1113929 RepID=UPI000853E341|nr:hypothetical protein [Arenibacter sp. NBRC 103722]GBF22556.1 hypothetical protein C21_04751 [Arenibacter sp. NBRC 103722]
MKTSFILLLTFFPLILIGQDLKCCETEKEIETYLNGNWKKKDADDKQQYLYEFNDGIGKFKVFDIKENGILERAEVNQPDIRILKKKTGFEIEHDFGGLKTYTGIKYLDSTRLIVTRRDGAEKEYYKVSK